MPSASAYGSPISSGAVAARPLTRNAVTFSRCQVGRSSRSSTAILVSKRTVPAMPDARPAVRVLYVLDVAGSDGSTAWRPPVPGVAEVFHAHFTDHAYPLHTHDTWTLLIVDDGAVALRPGPARAPRARGAGHPAAAARAARRAGRHAGTASASGCSTWTPRCSTPTLIGAAVDAPGARRPGAAASGSHQLHGALRSPGRRAGGREPAGARSGSGSRQHLRRRCQTRTAVAGPRPGRPAARAARRRA